MPEERILIVEDERLIALELSETLKSNGYLIAGTASSGSKALEMVDQLIPDLILMDIRLEGPLDGIKTARKIKKNHNIPVIFLSALSDRASLEQAKLAEPYGYIVKPFHEKSLLATIEMVLHKSRKIIEMEKRDTWFSSLLHDLGEAIIICNPANEVLFLNLSAERLLSLKAKDAQGKKISELFTLLNNQTKTPIKFPDHNDFIKHTNIFLEDLLLLRSNGKEISIDLSITPIKFDPSGLILDSIKSGGKEGKILLLRDIEARKSKNERIQKEIDTAIAMQRKLLPSHDTKINSIQAAWFLHPCSLGGGDLFHVMSVDKNHVVFYILDVMGHGIPATITSLMLHRFLTPDREKGGILKDTSQLLKPPVDVLTELNRQFYGQQPFQFVTLIYGIINTLTGRTQCVRAGHNYPVLQGKDGNISEILCEGAAIGLYPELALTEEEFVFERGSRLFFYSDGLIECISKERGVFSIKKLYSYIIETRSRSIKQLTIDLEALLFQWRGTNYFDDDVSFMVLERCST
ncbi:MAG: SpoIIE family protein phosphatase [Spirochaetales bacterium]|nr:SpoIIE family protein phosphatase [Spirochaetales bacterium]